MINKPDPQNVKIKRFTKGSREVRTHSPYTFDCSYTGIQQYLPYQEKSKTTAHRRKRKLLALSGISCAVSVSITEDVSISRRGFFCNPAARSCSEILRWKEGEFEKIAPQEWRRERERARGRGELRSHSFE